MRVFFTGVITVIVLMSIFPFAYSEKLSMTMEGSMEIEISYPDVIFPERKFPISVFVKNNGWENKKDVTFTMSNEEGSIKPTSQNKIYIDTISQGGTHGQTVEFFVPKGTSVGNHFVNIVYSQILMKNNQEAQQPVLSNIAIPIKIKDRPEVLIHTITPESIFTNAEFSFDVEIISKDVDLRDIELEIVVPQDIDFRGQTTHTLSSIPKNEPLVISSRIITPDKEVNTEYKTPFQVIFKYTDDLGEEQVYSKTIQMTLRPRTFFEITTDGGIWVGNIFVAPYISLGTVIGIPAGAILSVMIRRAQNKKKKRKITK